MTTLQAKFNILLPDGKTEVKTGETFEYDGDYSSFESVVFVVKEGKTSEKTTEEKALREKARLLGIKNYHNKGLEKLKEEIEEKENASPAPAPAHTPAREDEGTPEEETEGETNV